MSNRIDVVGSVSFDGRVLNIYGDVNEPLFRATDIAELFGYSDGNAWKLISVCEEKDRIKLTTFIGNQRRVASFVTMEGLFDIVFESRKPVAKELRKAFNDELIRYRKFSGKNITEQFDDWDRMNL